MPIIFRRDENFVGNCMEFVRSMPMKDDFGNVQSESFTDFEFGKFEDCSLWRRSGDLHNSSRF